MRQSRILIAAVAVVALAACGGEASSELTQEPSLSAPLPPLHHAGETNRKPPQVAPVHTELDVLFDKAAAEFGVPASLLKAISYTETRFQMVTGEQEFEGMPAAFGLMALRGERLEHGAKLAGVSAEQVRRDPLSNIRAAAALLSEEANGLKVNRADLSDWAPAVARFSGIENAEGQAAYVHKDVYAVLRQGVVVETSAGPVASLMPEQNLAPKFAEPSAITIQSADYAPAIWRPSPNYNARPTGSIGQVGMVIIHSCEGNYSGCWSWLTNSSAQASAHYVVNESGSEISQLVLESNRAWHISATYDCSLNSSVECWRNGYSSNHFTVGIEHGGFASQSSWSAGLLDTSAKLTCDITKQYGIARDRYHIVAHGQLQPATRTDPGPNWPWTDYLNRVNAACGAGTGLVIDSNNNNNDTSRGYIEASANWTSSANVAGYYGSGYYVAPTQAVSDPATFWFYLPAAATKTIDAWWTAASDRSTTTPFIVWNAAGTKLATVSVNQQINGSRWNVIGTYNFSAGWNKVQVSRWTTAGYQVVADAVRVR